MTTSNEDWEFESHQGKVYRRIWKEERERRNDLITCNLKKKTNNNEDHRGKLLFYRLNLNFGSNN